MALTWRRWCVAGGLSALWASQVWGSVTELTIATVDNRQMIQMQKLSSHFEKANPDIRLVWRTMQETELRRSVSSAVANGTATFDVVTVGMYETPIWAARGWLKAFNPDAAYNVKDLIPTVRDGLSQGGKLYAAPFYGEGSMTAYRTDLFAKAGLSTGNRPTWQKLAEAAAKLHKPEEGVYGICLRGRAGWGDNMALLSTMVNTFGGQWFDMQWQPRIASPAWNEAISFYVDLVKKYGPPSTPDDSFNENLNLFAQGRCAIWVDATSAGGALIDPKFSKVANQTGFALAPTQRSEKGAGWLWAWALAIPSTSQNEAAAQRFIQWATSQAYIGLVADTSGWLSVPSGTRMSTYRSRPFRKLARFAVLESIAMVTADPKNATLPPSPYVGVQFVAIPEFQEIGDRTGHEIREALIGKQTVQEALAKSQTAAESIMRDSSSEKQLAR